MVRQSNKKYRFLFDLALIFSMSSSFLIASYALPITALEIFKDSGKFRIAKTPDERQPEAVQQGIEQIPVSQPSVSPSPQPNQPIDSPIPAPVSPEPVDSNPTRQPTEGNSAPRPSKPVDSQPTPTPQPRGSGSAPLRQINRKPITEPGRGSNPTPQGSPVSLSRTIVFKEINFVDIAFGILSKGNFQSQGRYFHFYQFEGRENQLLQIRLGGSADQRRSSNLSLRPFMFLLDPNNNVLLKRSGGGATSKIRDAFIFTRLPVKGTYTIAVTSRNPGDIGRYSLALRNDRASYTLDESAQLTAQSSTLKQNGSSYNVSKFQGKKNQLVSIRADSINEEFSPYIVLLNSQGKTVAVDNNKDGMYSALIDRARLPDDDTYYVVVTSNNPNERGTYRLTIF